jgi:methyl-accepting chemotaxis protein
VDETGQALNAIVAKVAEIDQLISEIAQSSQEQSTGLSQVNAAVGQMDHVTQQNAAMVEQATAAASNLKSEAAELVVLIGRFRTSAHERSAAGPERAQPGHHAPARQPVALVREKRAASGGRAAAAAVAAEDWREF